jgi:hypothetical protein
VCRDSHLSRNAVPISCLVDRLLVKTLYLQLISWIAVIMILLFRCAVVSSYASLLVCTVSVHYR